MEEKMRKNVYRGRAGAGGLVDHVTYTLMKFYTLKWCRVELVRPVEAGPVAAPTRMGSRQAGKCFQA